jgi:hypothetical protein
LPIYKVASANRPYRVLVAGRIIKININYKNKIMKTYWQSFMEDYNKEILKKETHVMLEAFWHYCNNGKEKCKSLMKT